jgi:hypothetical protein
LRINISGQGPTQGSRDASPHLDRRRASDLPGGGPGGSGRCSPQEIEAAAPTVA